MTPGPVDAYLRRLERQLRQRGLEDARIIEEAREHLVDAVEDGRQRGLSVDDAAREAFERFGAPDTVAAQFVTERHRMMNRFAGPLGVVWRRKWWILAPTVVTAVVTSVVSYYFLPTRYQSVTSISVVPQRVPAEYWRPPANGDGGQRWQRIGQLVMSRPRLERLIQDFGLYQTERQTAPLGDVVRQMRRDIVVNPLTSPDWQDTDSGFTVSFVSSDPRMAMKVTERLASLFIEENLHEREGQAEGTTQVIESQIEDVRRRIIAYEETLENLRLRNGGRPLSQADLLPYEVLQETYRALLAKVEESRTAASLERRQVGEQFRIFEAARLPERPVGPSRLGVNLMGAFAGLGLGLVGIAVSSARRPRPEGTADRSV